MFLLIIFVLFFYYWLNVSFPAVKKHKKIDNRYVDLKGNFYENDKPIGGSSDTWDYVSQQSLPAFDYDIQSTPDQLVFTTYPGKEWHVPLTSEYFWTGDQIAEKDECFGKDMGNVPAKGKYLFDYVRHHELRDASIPQGLKKATRVYQNVDLFYFECRNGRIDKLHKCPPASTFEGTRCIDVDRCREKVDGFTYVNNKNKLQYYECQQGKSLIKSCPPKEIFEHDKCKTPDDICEMEADGFRTGLTKYTYGECVKGRMEIHQCNDGYYVLDGKCEYEKCFEKDEEMVATREIKFGPFSLYPFYGTCRKGKLTDVKRCPSNWDTSGANVDIVNLPKVFVNGQCVEPKLCENVQLRDPDAVIPAYHYAKHLATWPNAVYFDRTRGYKCNPNLQPVQVPHGSLINNYKITKACELGKIPTNDPNVYYDCTTAQTHTCPYDHFFDGTDCKRKNSLAFRFNNHLDVFQFDGLGSNNWMKARFTSSILPSNKICESNETLITQMDACVHVECTPYLFIRELQRSIKLDDQHQCTWSNGKIIKETYNNPKKLKLDFWKQKLLNDDTLKYCAEGERVETGNFVLDSTLFATCKANQPFVFCPSNATVGIQKVTNYYACRPNDSVYQYTSSAKKLGDPLKDLYRNEVDKLIIRAGSKYKIDNLVLQRAKTDLELRIPPMSIPNHPEKTFTFFNTQSFDVVFKTLVNNPPNTYILNRQLMECHNEKAHYSSDEAIGSFAHLKYRDYRLKDPVKGFKY